MIKKLKIISFMLFVLGSLLIGDSLIFYAKGFIGQELLKIAWEQTKISEKPTKPWSWSDTYPVAKLIIPNIDFEKIIIEGASDGSMDFGSGHLANTALPGEIGNCVIAGHRDTFFRHLGKLNIGDFLYIEGLNYSGWYKINKIKICTIDDVSLIQNLQRKSLTLVTCYPFNFIGAAPKRFVIQAFPDFSIKNTEV